MSPQILPERVEHAAQPWSVASRAAFRFCFVYFGLFCLNTQIFASLWPLPDVDIRDLATLWPLRQIVFWTAAHVFRVTEPLVYTGGSGDKTFDWVLAFLLLVLAALATAIWSVLDRRREDYATLYKWFRVFLRFALASQMMVYGLLKVVPVQMPFPYLMRLLEPYGSFSPMGVLWSSIGATPAYETFAGCAETLGGILLVFPRTTMLGALVCLADMIEVFALNMTYDVPVKLFSLHLILMSLILLAPDFSRLAAFFFFRRDVKASPEPELFATPRANRIALAVQVVIGIWLMGVNTYGSWTSWHTYGGGHPKSALYGIWDVEQFLVDAQSHPPLFTDRDRWLRAIFDFPTSMNFQRPDDSFSGYGVSINVNQKSLALTKGSDKKWKANFTFERPTRDQLILDGEMDGHKIHMQLRLKPIDKFPLTNRGFHWINEYPFNL